jgi:hypothetical protein
MAFIKFQDVASSANVANTFYYVAISNIKYVSTTATTVLFHVDGAGADGNADDTVTLTCASGDSEKLADMLIQRAMSISKGDIMFVDNGFLSGITDISPAVV